jgi:hypothetical protein
MPFTRMSTNVGISNKNTMHSVLRLRSPAAWNFFHTNFYNEEHTLDRAHHPNPIEHIKCPEIT